MSVSIRLRSGISASSITGESLIDVISGVTSDLDSFVTYFQLSSIHSLSEWAPAPSKKSSKGYIKKMYIKWKEYMGGKKYQTIPFKQMLKQLYSTQEKATLLINWMKEREEKKQTKETTATATAKAKAKATETETTTAPVTATATATATELATSTQPAPASYACYDLDVISHRDTVPSAYRCFVCDKVANQAVTCQHGKIMGHACYKMGTAGCDCTTNQSVVLDSLRSSIGELVARCPYHPPPTSTETTIHLTLATTELAAANTGTIIPRESTETSTSTLGCEWSGKLENLDRHLNECVWVPVACPHERCPHHQIGQGAIIRRGDLASHIASCELRSSPCPDCSVAMVYADISQHQATTCQDHVIECINEGCLEKMPRKDLQGHIDTCAHTLVLCSLGCGHSIPRGQILAHESNVGALSSHLHVLRDLIPSHTSTTSTMNPIRTSVDAVISRVAQLEQQQNQHVSSMDELKNQVLQLQTCYDMNEMERKQQKESIVKLTSVLQQRVGTAKETTDAKLVTITNELDQLKRMMETLTVTKKSQKTRM